MHRIPLWGAIIIEVLLIFLAIGGNTDEYIIDQEKIWTMIGINFVLILIPIVKRIYSNSQEKEYTNSFVSEQKIRTKIQERDPETLFGMALLILQNSKSEEEKEQALGAIVYAAQNGYQPAINLIEDLKAKQSS
jgi:hypothetical protein